MPIPFEASRTYVYNAARYELLPRVAEITKAYGDQPFLLRDISRQLLAETYTHDQLAIMVPRRVNAERTDRLSAIFMYYIPFLAENLKVLENLGGGMFRNILLEEEMAEADVAVIDVDADDTGIIYAYSFPSIVREDGVKFPIKVGLTTTDDADARVSQQCKTTCCFEFPVILGVWKVQRVASMERCIHLALENRGSKRRAPGIEWFDTTREEVESIIKFVQSSAHAIPRP